MNGYSNIQALRSSSLGFAIDDAFGVLCSVNTATLLDQLIIDTPSTVVGLQLTTSVNSLTTAALTGADFRVSAYLVIGPPKTPLDTAAFISTERTTNVWLSHIYNVQVGVNFEDSLSDTIFLPTDKYGLRLDSQNAIQIYFHIISTTLVTDHIDFSVNASVFYFPQP